MLCVSCRLLACSRPISSWMLTSVSEVTCRSSSILASSSAIGCSKSRNETAIAKAYPNSAAVGRECGRGRQRGIHHLHRARTEQALELIEQLAAGAHRPLRPERHRATRRGPAVLDGD